MQVPGEYVVVATYGEQTGNITYKVTALNPELIHSSHVGSDISMEVDKKSYTVGETVELKGSVKNLNEGKNEVRLDSV